MTETFTLQPGALSLNDLRVLMHGECDVHLDAEAIAAVEAAAATVARVARGHAPVYGVNTGFGSLARERIGPEDVGELQRRLVLSHMAGVGPPLADPAVRLVLILKANALGRGHSGVRRELIDDRSRPPGKAPIPPAPDTGLGLAGLGHDRRVPEPLVALQDDPRPPDMFLRALRVRDDRLQSLTVARRDSKMDAGAHSTDSHDTAQYGISNQTLSFRSIH